MMGSGWIGLLLGVGLGLAFVARRSSAVLPTLALPVVRGEQGLARLRELGEAAQLHPDWRTFFVIVARRESRGTSNVCLGDARLFPRGAAVSPVNDRYGASEAEAARLAYARSRAQGLLACEWPAAAYEWGSGGWLGMIPANAWRAYVGTPLECRHPHYLLHPVDTVVTAIEMARRLTKRPEFKQPTWLTVLTGWGSPAGMDDAAARERARRSVVDELAAEGLDPSWLDRAVVPLPPSDPVRLHASLMARFSS